ncbi:MAG TPA: hypothetical protein VKT51_09875 [Candidatus Eremiobacteraceae bacterium]|nr:hypothetical protein [Candidatus Eremiobacteraceae bacterium]
MTFAPTADHRDEIARSLDERIARYMTGAPDDDEFERVARKLFAYQYERNAPYRAFCDRMGRRPGDVAGWRDAPPISAASFGEARLACFPAERSAFAFVSSGTTSSGRASRHELDAAALYTTSLETHYRTMVLPDAAGMRHIFLAPPFQEAPHSSLSFMLSALAARFGSRESGFFLRGDSLEMADLARALRSVEPCVVFGTAFAFVHLFDRCRMEGKRYRLPQGSRIVETGGFKGKSREVERDVLYGWFEEYLGVPRSFCVSEYGMCELGSQWYDANIADEVAGNYRREHVKVGPHWTRAIIVDPVTAEELPAGAPGLLRVYDLSNRGSVASILTGDLARTRDGGIEIIGRNPGAPPKGCSIAADAILSVTDS